MHSDLSLALQIQEIDLHIDDLTAEIDGFPKREAAVKQHLASHKQALEDLAAALEENGKEHRQFEREIDDQRQKVEKLQDQMNGAKTNDQFRAFQHEIQFCQDAIDKLEEKVLAKMEEAEGLTQDVSKAEADLKTQTAKVDEELQEARARTEAALKEREQVQAEREELGAKIEPATLKAYDRIRQSRGIAMAAVEGENCGKCHVRLRPKVLQDLGQLTEGVITCESCGLIIYRPEESAVPVGP